ncbi:MULTISPECIES: LysR family transcriptional regulator [Alphaproteobacteria]|uniref:LysR family transcriptional regulator n=1 Tax=Alphaproteobacteria TaxID=28211 RepID=UPI0032989032
MRSVQDIRVLDAFITVAREGNVSRAAEKLHLTQPAVSLQLKRLAQDTGLTLFTRTSKGLELTRDGTALIAKAEKVRAALTEFGQTARRVSGDVRGTLRIGTIVDPGFIRLGQFLSLLVEGFPDLRTKLTHGMSGEVINRIIADHIDVGFYLGSLAPYEPAIDPDQLDGASLFHERELTTFTYQVLAPKGWEDRVIGKDWQALADLPWIGTPQDSVHCRLLDAELSEDGITPNYVCSVDQEPSMLAMVRSGVGLSLCRESIALDEMQTRGLVVADQVSIQTSLRFITLKSRAKDPNVKAAFEVLASAWD